MQLMLNCVKCLSPVTIISLFSPSIKIIAAVCSQARQNADINHITPI